MVARGKARSASSDLSKGMSGSATGGVAAGIKTAWDPKEKLREKNDA